MTKRVKMKTRARAKAKRATSTALVPRRTVTPAKATILPALPEDDRNLTDDIMLGGLGLVDVRLKPEEEAVLNEPVRVTDIAVKPTGQPYLPHPVYTRWFIRAFGRLGWALVPVSKPAKAIQGKKVSVVVPYVLYIHGQPAAFAQGEQDYYEDNPEQTYGDALESTVASGLRRCAKRLGVGLEMWDRRYLEAFIETHCVRVQIEVKNRRDNTTEKKWVVRLKTAAPFFNEIGGRSRHRDPEPTQPSRYVRQTSDGPEEADDVDGPWRPTTARTVPPALITVPADQRATHGAEGEKITLAQRQRLAMIVNNSDRSDEEVNGWLRTAYGIDNIKPTRDILRRDYDAIARALEAPGKLPAGRAK